MMNTINRIEIVDFLAKIIKKCLVYDYFNKFSKSFMSYVISGLSIEFRVQWQKLSGKNASDINLWFHSTKYSILNEFARKKSIMIHDLFWHQKLPRIMFIYITYLILKNILVNMIFRDKMLVPYCKKKRQKIHIFNLVHRRTILLAESRGSSRFFIT